jgi:hypothetical protein
MRDNLRKVCAVILLLMLALAAISFLFQRQRAGGIRQEVADTRRALREQGFKTDLADFNLRVTDPAIRSREAALTAFASLARGASPVDELDLLPTMPDGSGIILWKQDWLPGREGAPADWSDLETALAETAPELDAADEAAVAGPIQFDLDASRGRAMLLPHLAALRHLESTLSSRMVVELHAGHADAAWTNALALTRLCSAWKVEPVGISEMVRFALTQIGFNAMWQALQGAGWPDEKLAALQHEWERADFFANLPDTVAFQRASDVAFCQQVRQEPLAGGTPFSEIIRESIHSPSVAISAAKASWNAARYRSYGTYDDEKKLLLFHQQREQEMRRAIAAPTWAEMRTLPGVTNPAIFISPYRSRFQMLNLQSLHSRLGAQGSGLLARAATAESERRIIVTAIALERFRQQHGAYPRTLAELAPEFLKSAPIDFMDGQPLRYRADQAGHFMLYSVGVDCADHGGRPVASGLRSGRRPMLGAPGFAGPEPGGDLVWPFPAAAEAVQSLRQQEERAQAIQQRNEEEQAAEQDWTQSPGRQARVDKILATAWNPDAGKMTFYGQSLGDYVRNEAALGTNRPTLTEMLAPKRVLTGAEPEDITFEVPLHYEAVTNAGELTLVVDADPDAEETMGDDAGGKQQELLRATNGNCLVVWHTIFDPPGRHAVQFLLVARTERGGFFAGRGPAVAVTTSNLCQFSLDSATYDVETGARFHARLPETHGSYSIECVTTNGVHLATLSGNATNGEFNTVWNLVDEHGHKLGGETFNSIVHLTLPDSGRTQTLRGP